MIQAPSETISAQRFAVDQRCTRPWGRRMPAPDSMAHPRRPQERHSL